MRSLSLTPLSSQSPQNILLRPRTSCNRMAKPCPSLPILLCHTTCSFPIYSPLSSPPSSSLVARASFSSTLPQALFHTLSASHRSKRPPLCALLLSCASLLLAPNVSFCSTALVRMRLASAHQQTYPYSSSASSSPLLLSRNTHWDSALYTRSSPSAWLCYLSWPPSSLS